MVVVEDMGHNRRWTTWVITEADLQWPYHRRRSRSAGDAALLPLQNDHKNTTPPPRRPPRLVPDDKLLQGQGLLEHKEALRVCKFQFVKHYDYSSRLSRSVTITVLDVVCSLLRDANDCPGRQQSRMMQE